MKYLIYTMLMVSSFSGADPYPKVSSKVPGEIRVMIVDTGVGPNTKLDMFMEKDASSNYSDTHGHGTHIAGLVALGEHLKDPVCSQVKIYSCKFYDEKASNRVNVEHTIDCLRQALTMKIDVLNYSAGGPESEDQEYWSLTDLIKSGTEINVAAGNGRDGKGENLNKVQYYPAQYALKPYLNMAPLSHMNVIENMCPNGKLCSTSNYFPGLHSELGNSVLSTAPGDQLIRMSGTSQATAIFTHKMLIQKCKEAKGSVYGKR